VKNCSVRDAPDRHGGRAPLIQRLRFEGNKQVKDKDLTKELGLKPGGPMTKTAVQEDVTRITEIYRRNGRYQVQVTPNTITRGADARSRFRDQGRAKTASSASRSSATANLPNRV